MFDTFIQEGTVPLPEHVVKALEGHCQKMTWRSDRDAERDPFERYLPQVDLERELKVPWIPEWLSPLYGTRFYAQCSEAQKLALNHMGWVAHYQYSVIGELLTLQYNNACGRVFRHNGYDHIATYLERESLEEELHIDTFSKLGDAVETHYLGRPMLRARMAEVYTLHPNGFAGFNGWTATAFYYWLRGHQNIALRAREQALQEADTTALAPRITEAHFRDETRHYATSHLLAELMAEVEPQLPAPVKLAFIAGRSFNGPQSGCNWIWPTTQVTPGLLIDITAQLLSHPVFGLKSAEVLDVLEEVYSQRSTNPEWEHMRLRTERNALALNQRVPWLPAELQGPLSNTLRYNLDKGLPYARKALKEFKARQAVA